jgi:hypothetical protein
MYSSSAVSAAALISPSLATFLLPLAQAADDASPQQAQNPLAGAVGGVIGLVFGLIAIVSLWKIFTKAGWPGWASIIPFYNFYVICRIAGKPGWWLVLMLIPLVNFIVAIIVFFGLAKSFGKGAGFALGLILLGIIFLPILAFGDARYQGATAPA